MCVCAYSQILDYSEKTYEGDKHPSLFHSNKEKKFYKAWAYMSGAAYGNWLHFYLPVLDYSEKSFKKEANTLAYFVMTKNVIMSEPNWVESFIVCLHTQKYYTILKNLRGRQTL